MSNTHTLHPSPPAAYWQCESSCSKQMETWGQIWWICWASWSQPDGHSSSSGTEDPEHGTVQRDPNLLKTDKPPTHKSMDANISPTCTMMLSLEAASWASLTQRFTTSKLIFTMCCKINTETNIATLSRTKCNKQLSENRLVIG